MRNEFFITDMLKQNSIKFISHGHGKMLVNIVFQTLMQARKILSFEGLNVSKHH